MKRFRNVALMEDPEIYQVPTYDFEVSPLAVSVASVGVMVTEPVFLPLPIKTVSYIDPALSVPSSEAILTTVKPVNEPIITPLPIAPILEPVKVITFVDPVLDAPAIKSTIPILPIEDEPITLNEANKSSDTPVLITPSDNSGVANPTVVEKVVDTINKAVDEIFKTEVTKDNTVVKDNTGLYLAGAVVALGVLALIFKK